jgi:phage gp46-like protein
MSDISTVWNGTQGDWQLSGKSLASGRDLITAITISLFTDRQAEPDDAVTDGTDDLRGWWGDSGADRIGSRLWLLERSKRTQATLQLAQTYIAEALQWLIDDGVVAGFEIRVEWDKANQLSAQVVALRIDGTTQAMNFAWAWNGIN